MGPGRRHFVEENMNPPTGGHMAEVNMAHGLRYMVEGNMTEEYMIEDHTCRVC